MDEQKGLETKELLSLFEISQALSSTLVLDELFELVLQSAKNVIQADRGSIILYDRKKEKLYLKASFGMDDKKEMLRNVPVEGGIAVKVVETKKPLLLRGDMNEISFLKGISKRDEIKSAMSVPLIARNEVVGVFNLSRLSIETSFTERELSFLTIFAGPVAIAINNAQLYHRIKNMAVEAENERDKLKAIIENISNGIMIYNNKRIIPLFNSTAAKILRMDNNISEVITIDELFKNREDLKPILLFLNNFENSSNNFLEHEFTLNISGEILYINVSCIKLLSHDEKDLNTIIILEDHTRMVQTQKIAAWQGMARYLAHEIKNPLTPILWSAEFLLDPDVQESPDFINTVSENSNTIIKEVKRLQELVSDFSSFSKMPEIVLKPDRIERILEDVIAMYTGMPLNIKIKTRFHPDIPPVMVDAEMIKQVFINLIKNAIEAMPDGGELTIKTISLEDKVFIEFTDTGIGIPPGIQGKVIDPYFTTKESGTGLGLTICSKIVSDHGGHIKIMSKENEGTTIIVILPAGTKENKLDSSLRSE